MSRCKSCNHVLTSIELSRTKPDGLPEDLCGECGKIVFLDLEDLLDYRSYAFGDLTESGLGQIGVLEPSVHVPLSGGS